MTKADIQDIRKRLMAERERVVASLHRNVQHVLAETVEPTKDPGDRASASHDRDVLYLLQDSDARRLRMIDSVLPRMDDAEYGLCGRCEQPIGKARLHAIPWAMTCIRCQEELDRKEFLSQDVRVRVSRTTGEYEAA